MSEIELWRDQAGRDLAAAHALLESGLHGHAAFHIQQAIEKALKSLVIARSKQLLRTHDLVVLAEKSGQTLEADEQTKLEELNVLYTDSRYPGQWGLLPEGQPSAVQLEGYLALAKRILTFTP